MIRILAVGNSFSQDALAYLTGIAESGGTEIETGNLFIGGCALRAHWNNAKEDLSYYDYEINGKSTGQFLSLNRALQLNDWDIVTFQQASGESGDPETYRPYLQNLSDYVRERAPEAKQALHQTWAYEIGCESEGFRRYHNDQAVMYAALSEAYDRAAAVCGLPLIPVGRVIQRLRKEQPFAVEQGGLSLCRDGFHLQIPYGRYAAAMTWYGVLLGGNVSDNAAIPEPGADRTLLELIRRTITRVLEGEKDDGTF
ncbi:MAG: DUF4886 domain-containing protein [Oscillospiraceae bacterium]|nr:DUF4886 domain-containing protein [Oscillospiraceae bacterium]